MDPLGTVSPELKFWVFSNRSTADYIKRNSLQFPFYYWTFRLHNHLRLNLSFEYIYFSAKHVNILCHMAEFVVNDCEFFVSRLLPMDSFQKWKWVNFSQSYHQYAFCGTYSKVTLYSKCPNVAVKTDMKFYVVHDIKLSFSVVDNGKLHSIPMPTWFKRTHYGHNFWKALVSAVFFPHSVVLLQVYKLETLKYQVLSVILTAIEGSAVELYDGPDTLSTSLRFTPISQEDIIPFETSSFECLIYTYNFNKSLSYSAKYNTRESVTNHIVIKPGTFVNVWFPSLEFCNSKDICIFFLKTDNSHKVNLSRTNIKFHGQHRDDCRYAGTTTYEGGKEITTYCPKMFCAFETSESTGGIFLPQNDYSSNNTMLLVIYLFREYGHLTTNFRITTTHCKPFIINVCERKYRTAEHMTGLFYVQMAEYPFNVDENECIILQLTYNTQSGALQDHEIQRCELDLKPKSNTSLTRRLKLYATGFFTGKLSEFFVGLNERNDNKNFDLDSCSVLQSDF